MREFNILESRGSYLADEFDFISFDVLDNHDTLLGQEVERKVVGSISEDRFLDEEDIGATLFDLLNQTGNISSFFLQDSVHSRVILDDDTVFNISLGGRKAELDQGNLGILNSSGATSRMGGFIVSKDQTFNHFSIFDSTTELLDNLDVSQINIIGHSRVDTLNNGVSGRY